MLKDPVMKLTIFLLLFSQALSAQELAWPEITRTRKPWTRWWWPGSIVTQQDLITAMEKYQKADLGGMEIAVIYGVKGQEDKFINYLSPKWREMFTHTLREGERLNLGIDLAEYFLHFFRRILPKKCKGTLRLLSDNLRSHT